MHPVFIIRLLLPIKQAQGTILDFTPRSGPVPLPTIKVDDDCRKSFDEDTISYRATLFQFLPTFASDGSGKDGIQMTCQILLPF
jgi:hypothetical protein